MASSNSRTETLSGTPVSKKDDESSSISYSAWTLFESNSNSFVPELPVPKPQSIPDVVEYTGPSGSYKSYFLEWVAVNHLANHANSQAYFLGESFSPSSLNSMVNMISLNSDSSAVNGEMHPESILARSLFLPCDDIWGLLSALNAISDMYKVQVDAITIAPKFSPPIIVVDNIDQLLSDSCSGQTGIEISLIGKVQRTLSRVSTEAHCSIILSTHSYERKKKPSQKDSGSSIPQLSLTTALSQQWLSSVPTRYQILSSSIQDLSEGEKTDKHSRICSWQLLLEKSSTLPTPQIVKQTFPLPEC